MRTNCVRCGQFRNNLHQCRPIKLYYGNKFAGYLDLNEKRQVVKSDWNPMQTFAKWSLAILTMGVFYHFASLLAQAELNHFFL